MLLALLGTAIGAVLVLATAGQPRWTVDGAATSGGGAPAATALALVALAGVGLLLLVRGRARTALGLLLLVVGAGVVLVNVRVGKPAFGSPLGADQSRGLHRSTWFWLTALGGALVAVGGAVITAYGHRWPSSRREYQATPPTAARPRDPWTALDRGEDPTL
jgi:tryptophan-associated transmembrane protein